MPCLWKRHDCSNPHNRPEEDKGDSQQSEVDFDDFAGEESD